MIKIFFLDSTINDTLELFSFDEHSPAGPLSFQDMQKRIDTKTWSFKSSFTSFNYVTFAMGGLQFPDDCNSKKYEQYMLEIKSDSPGRIGFPTHL